MKNNSKNIVDLEGLKPAIWGSPQVAPSDRTIARHRKAGIIPCIRLGALIYYDVEQVRLALKSRGKSRGK
jgi:hypothetical protein